MFRTLITATVAAALTMGAAGIALADENDGGGHFGDRFMMQTRELHPAPAIHGSVTAISGATISMSANGTTVTVDASNANIVRISGQAIQASDIEVGDTILVQGTFVGNTVHAGHIVDGIAVGDRGPQPMREHMASTTDRGDWQDATNVPERFMGEKEGILMGIGKMLGEVAGKDKKDNKGKAPMQGPAIGGQITSVSTNSFTLELPAREDHATTTATIVTDASTTYVMVGGTAATFGDVSVGRFARVQGPITSTSTMTLTARRVEIATTTPPKMMGDRGERPGERMMGTTSEQEVGDNGQNRDNGLHLGFLQRLGLRGSEATDTPPRIQFTNGLKNFLGKLGGFFHF